jgi:hypothetical protein
MLAVRRATASCRSVRTWEASSIDGARLEDAYPHPLGEQFLSQ